MNDCPNANVRDLLPDLVHGRLDVEARAMVEAHVAGCADCRWEVALLRDLRASRRRTPQLDLAAIAAVVPAYHAPARRSWTGWRAAAAIIVLVAGASSVALLQRNVDQGRSSGSLASVASSSVPAPGPAPVRAPSTHAVTAPAQTSMRETAAPVVASPPAPSVRVADAGRDGELAMGGGSLSDLNDRELASLLKDIESLDAVPSIEVDNTQIAPISPATPRRATP